MAVDVVTEPPMTILTSLDREFPLGACTEIRLGKDRELPIYKDFTVLGLIEMDPRLGHAVKEPPLLGSFAGVIRMTRLGPARRLKSLHFLSKLMVSKNTNSLFVPVMLCGEDPYQGFLGHVELEALAVSRQESFQNELPPSTSVNPVPSLN